MISIYARTIADSVAPISDSVALISDIVAPISNNVVMISNNVVMISNNVVMISNDAAPRSDIVTPLSNDAPAKTIYARPKSNSARPKCHVTLAISDTAHAGELRPGTWLCHLGGSLVKLYVKGLVSRLVWGQLLQPQTINGNLALMGD